MYSIFRKEINTFFSTLIGYLVIGQFLFYLGAVMFIFPDSSLLNYGYASMDQLFSFAPQIFIFLIPAISMSAFAEEQKSGTMELLATQPLNDWKIILGKFLADLSLVVFALIPTVLYYYTVYQLGNPKGNLDSGAILGSYLGLIFLASAFTAIGIFASTLTKDQIVAFILATFLCVVFYYGFELISTLPIFAGKSDYIVQMLGIDYHYDSMSRGVFDSRDVIYFFSLTFFFVFLTKLSLQRRNW